MICAAPSSPITIAIPSIRAWMVKIPPQTAVMIWFVLTKIGSLQKASSQSSLA